MRENKIVQFVSFETLLDTEQFIIQWEQFTKPDRSDQEITLQQSKKNDLFRYIAQHRYTVGKFDFVFSKARRSPHSPATPIRIEHEGGYSVLQLQRMNEARENESKIFAFVTSPSTDLNIFRQLSLNGKLNIYEAYYESCQYAYILEYFVKNEKAADLLHQLQERNTVETGIYRECVMEIS